MKCFAIVSLVGAALSTPQYYGLGAYPYALPYAVYNPLASGLVYPVAAPYVHDASGDEAPAYVHDTAGDARKKRDADAQVLPYPYALPYAAYNPLASGLVYPVAAPYVHDVSGDEAPAYVHDTAGDARKKREADAQVLYGGYPYALGAYGYAGLPYGLPFAPLVAHPNGA